MITTLQLVLEREKDAVAPIHASIASLLHGFLMREIDTEYAKTLHTQSYHPYHQYIQVQQNKILWTIHTMQEEAKEQIIDRLLRINAIHLEQREERFTICSKDWKTTSFDSLVREHYLKEQSPRIHFSFLSPTSFKQDGRYVIYPSTRLIFQSLMRKWDAFSTEYEIFTPEVLQDFEQHTSIVGYQLRSTFFSLEGIKIPSFIGKCTIQVYGPKQMSCIANLLAHFGTYSGIGIKTGMGMGGMNIWTKNN